MLTVTGISYRRQRMKNNFSVFLRQSFESCVRLLLQNYTVCGVLWFRTLRVETYGCVCVCVCVCVWENIWVKTGFCLKHMGENLTCLDV